jgi:aarF domain-containing kinase
LDDIFLEFDPEPLGVGAIAQVYKGKLRPEIVLTRADIRHDFMVDKRAVTLDCVTVTDDATGQTMDVHTAVAIKVIHPKARQIVRRDLKIMMAFATLLDWIPTMHWLSLPDEVRVFGSMMKDQLDLRIEGHHLDKFNYLFRDDSDIRFPMPFMYFSSRDVLVEEYEKGVPLGIFLTRAAGLKRKQQQGDPSPSTGVFDHKIASIGK